MSNHVEPRRARPEGFRETTPNHVFTPWFRLLTLLVVIFLSTLVGVGVGFAILSANGVDQAELYAQIGAGEYGQMGVLRWVLLVNQLFSFALPALLTAWYLYRSDWLRRLDLRPLPAPVWLALGTLFIFLGMFVAQFLLALGQNLPLPDWATQLEDQTNGLIQAMLQFGGRGDLLLALFIMAVLPAVGEELVFRGFLQRNLKEWFGGRGVLAVWVAAAIFSAIHFQFEGFLSRMVLGALMGYLYLWSRSLWVPIVAHFFNNAFFVFIAYHGGDLLDQARAEVGEGPPDIPWVSGLLCSVTVVAFGIFLAKWASERLKNSDT